ncbi:MAG: hypothetical protein CM15mP128_2760 [Methanobacteriota archaeon]|nr:MAG: hypothetical protein CM15mP128_2760 [Euryarchaeota archaeon]
MACPKAGPMDVGGMGRSGQNSCRFRTTCPFPLGIAGRGNYGTSCPPLPSKSEMTVSPCQTFPPRPFMTQSAGRSPTMPSEENPNRGGFPLASPFPGKAPTSRSSGPSHRNRPWPSHDQTFPSVEARCGAVKRDVNLCRMRKPKRDALWGPSPFRSPCPDWPADVWLPPMTVEAPPRTRDLRPVRRGWGSVQPPPVLPSRG